jgi:Cd2+/Zn2+-exporting ATPase
MMVAALLLPDSGYKKPAAMIITYAAIGYDVLWKAVRNIINGRIFDENFLMGIATIGAIIIGEYTEAVTVMLFYQIGEFFQDYAIGHSRRSVADLMDINPDYADVERGGAIVRVEPREVRPGETIIIKPGERIPLDGEIIHGESSIDTSSITGEALPADIAVGDTVISGCININGVLRVRVDRPFTESTVSRILDMVENQSLKKAKTEKFITRFARYYTPAVVIGAILLAVIPPLFGGGNWEEHIYRALVFLVVSCPCALVISVPMSFFGGIGGAARHGILFKGSGSLESLSKSEIMVFDKTGTLTSGKFSVTGIYPVSAECSADELLRLAAYAECYSGHPISQALRDAYGQKIDCSSIGSYKEIAGRGIKSVVDGRTVYAGNIRLMNEYGISTELYKINAAKAKTTVHIAAGGYGNPYLGYITLADTLKADAAKAITGLRKLGIRRLVMLTGDTQTAGEEAAHRLGFDEVYAGLLPDGKVRQVERMLDERSANGKLIFVGDGINDAPVLMRADCGIAMGALGSGAAIEAADVVLTDDRPSKVTKALKISYETMRIVKQNIIFALTVKAVILVLGSMGLTGMWAAVFADVGVSVLAILNAMRTLRSGR